MSVYNNIALPLRYHTALLEPEIEDKVTEGLRLWGIEHLRDWFPTQLMLSDARFAALARALILNPEILFLDDMLLGLDAWGLARLRAFFESVRAKRAMTLVTSAGVPTKLLEIFDRVVFFEDGRIVADGAPAEVVRMPTPAVQEFHSV
jgi:phospholipid/cholesterol/gamma-HCH transport system ATP-binding protein